MKILIIEDEIKIAAAVASNSMVLRTSAVVSA